MMDLNIPVTLGTAREGRESEAAAKFVHKLVERTGVQSELVDVRDYVKPATEVDWMDNVDVSKWVSKAEEADGFIIVSPEYNHFFPGELKILLDQTLAAYKHKPAGLAGVSAGQWGGTRVVEHLRTYTSRLGMVAIHPAAYFPNIKEAFDDSGEPKDPKLAEFTQPMIDEVIWYASALKSAR